MLLFNTTSLNNSVINNVVQHLYGGSFMDTAGIYGRAFKVAGDSRTASSSTVQAGGTVPIVDRTANYTETSGMIGWALANCGGRASFDPLSNYGVGGDDTSELLARISDITADPAHNVVVLIGANDRGGANFTLQQSIDNLDDILDALLATSDLHPNGHRVYLCSEMPYESLTGTQLANHTAFRDHIRALNRPNVHIIETWTAVATSSTANEFTAGYDLDGLHPVPIGFQFAAVPLSEMIESTILPRGVLLASDSTTGVINANYDMAGTSGTGVTGIFTGDLATGWVAAANATYSGVTVTLSKETRADGYEWQKVVFSGTPDTANGFIWFYNIVSSAGFVVGDLYYGAGRVEYENLDNIVNVSLEMLGVSVTRKSRALDGYDSTRLIYSDSNGEQIQVLPLQGFASGATAARIALNIKWGTNTDPVAGTIWFRDMTAREASIAPMLITAPAITGTAQVGETLTCSTGTWQGTQSITYAYQWKANGVAIVGATSSTYLLTASEEGDTITCTVTATNSAGSNTSTSAATSAVAPAATPYVNSVKYYSVTVGSGQTSNTVTIDAVGAKALIFPTFESSGTSTAPSATMGRVELTNSTTITLTRNTASTVTITAWIAVVDATDALVDNVRYGTVSLAAATSGTASITSVDTSRSSPVYLGMTSDSGSQSAGRQNSRVTLTDATTVTGTTSNAITGTIGFMIVDWADAAISSVENVVATFTSANTSDTTTITSVDVNRSMVFHGGCSGALSNSRDVNYLNQLTAATTITHTRGGTATTSRTINASVVQFASGVFAINNQRGTIDLTGVTSNTATITDIGTSKGFVNFNGYWNNNNSQPTTTFSAHTLTNGTTVTASINGTGNTQIHGYEAGKFA